MNAERLLAQFERISEAPDAIPRLRRFILDLAVRGKLVEQDPEDEPAEELLRCITKHREDLVRATREESAFAFDLPTGWVHTTLRALVETSSSGWSPKTLDTPREGDAWGILKVSAVSWDQFRPEANKQVLPGTHPKPQAIVKKGDFLISRANTAELVARAVIVEREPVNLMMSDKIVRLELVELCEAKYILIVNNHFSFSRAYYAERATGVSPSMKNVTRDVILDLPIPLPPLAEQHRIVAKVDELMALCDQLEAARQERQQGQQRLVAASLQRLNQPADDPESFRQQAGFALKVLPRLTTTAAEIKQLRQTILNLAVRGKLVEQDPEDEPAGELLKRISAEITRKRTLRIDNTSCRIKAHGIPVDTPLATGWSWIRLDQIALSMRYGTSTKCEYQAGGVPVLRIPNVSSRILCLNDIKFGQLSDAEKGELSLDAGDILVIRSNGSLDNVGRPAVVTKEARGMAFAGYLVRVRLSPANIKSEFIWLALNSTDVRDQIERPIRSAVGLKNINLTELGGLAFPLPPLAEQHRIVARVDELMALCAQLEQQLNAGEQLSRKLLEAVVQEALGEPEKALGVAYA